METSNLHYFECFSNERFFQNFWHCTWNFGSYIFVKGEKGHSLPLNKAICVREEGLTRRQRHILPRIVGLWMIIFTKCVKSRQNWMVNGKFAQMERKKKLQLWPSIKWKRERQSLILQSRELHQMRTHLSQSSRGRKGFFLLSQFTLVSLFHLL